MSEGALTFLGIIGGGAFLTFLQFLINRHDTKVGKKDAVLKAIEKIEKELEKLRGEAAEDRADNARIRILQFSDECRHGTAHSKEHFDQINQDIDRYRAYCNANPTYQNNRSVQAIANIERIYQKCLADNKFLD